MQTGWQPNSVHIGRRTLPPTVGYGKLTTVSGSAPARCVGPSSAWAGRDNTDQPDAHHEVLTYQTPSSTTVVDELISGQIVDIPVGTRQMRPRTYGDGTATCDRHFSNYHCSTRGCLKSSQVRVSQHVACFSLTATQDVVQFMPPAVRVGTQVESAH